MGVSYTDMMATPFHIILKDLEMIELENKYPPKEATE